MLKSDINYKNEIIIKNHTFFNSPALVLAKAVSGDRENFKIIYEEKWLSADIFAQKYTYSYFYYRKIEKVKIAHIAYDYSVDKMIYQTEEAEYDAASFKLNYEIVKGLRDQDLIQIKNVEKVLKHKVCAIYTLAKSVLQDSSFKVEPGIYGKLLIVEKSLFVREVVPLAKKRRQK